MEKVRLGRTNIEVTRTSFGALPIQRRNIEDAKRILRKAYDSGINYFDTARMYSDSEEKIGYALSDVRKNIIISTKSHAKDGAELKVHLKTSLEKLKTDYIDIYQLHNPKHVPTPDDDPFGIWQALEDAKKSGKIRHIGITQHSKDNANYAMKSGCYETMQFPLSCISDQNDIDVALKAKELDISFIGMKALCGGLISNAKLAFAYLRQYEHVVPIWGIQHEWELDEILSYDKNPPVMTDEMLAEIKEMKDELSHNFCRACGYCLPCSKGINIPMAARMKYLLGRAVWQTFVSEEWQAEMKKIDDCTNCGLCAQRCPYNLDTPQLLKYMKGYYDDFCSSLKEEEQ